MAAIDLLFDAKLTSERLHQLALGPILTKSALLSKLGIDGTPTRDDWEPKGGLFDLAVALAGPEPATNGSELRVWIELKIDSGLGFDQLDRQLAFLEGGRDHALYLLLGTSALHSDSEWLRDRVKTHRANDGALGLVLTSLDLEELLWTAAREHGIGHEARDVRDLLTAYRDALIRLRWRVEHFEVQPLDSWGYADYLGFFAACRTRIPSMQKDAWIGYVPGPTGGFMAAAWRWTPVGTDGLRQVYLHWEGDFGQASDLKLCFRIEVDDKKNARNLRQLVHHEVLRIATDLGIAARKPSRFGTGRTMTVAVLEDRPLSEATEWSERWSRIEAAVRRAESVLEALDQERSRIGHV